MAGAGGSGGSGGGGLRDMDALEGVRSIVLKPSESLDEGRFTRIAGADFNDAGLGLSGLLASLASTGFQASNLGDAVDVVNQMLEWRLSHEKPHEDCDEAELDPTYRESVKCKIFLGFTSNLVSSGIRDVIRFLVQHHMVDVIVTTAGGIEEDIIKCLAPTYRGDFSLPGMLLRSKGLNRIGNLLVPNDNYCKFENWIMPLFDQMLQEQSTENVWTPSKVIARLGKEINDESSYLYWAYKNNIPIYCPALTDGSLGDMLFCHAVRNPGLIIDIVQGKFVCLVFLLLLSIFFCHIMLEKLARYTIDEWGSHSCNSKEDRDHSSWWRSTQASYMQCQYVSQWCRLCSLYQHSSRI
ncbi:hypothetical protein E2562_008294 [Oryza meyeriana var. granulata]|uniref:Deoxyhypusine synthase n=1 Tax=Oryza meyeriana var. granulata TaxID=110450 RepID=A0A6G1DFL8_9ORYZ|nr:hypothetical protein E2562_008294 [Oryza meyeriana var. granulata]